MSAKTFHRQPSESFLQQGKWYLFSGIVVALLLVGVVTWVRNAPQQPQEAPEAPKVLAIQAKMPFQILIPAYLPRDFDRAGVEIDIAKNGPGGEPLVQLTYHNNKGQPLYVQEWVPVNPDSEVLSASRPVETKWGKGWLLVQGDQLAVLWVDVGPLRVSVYTNAQNAINKEQILEAAQTLGPASNQQVFSFVVDQPVIKEAAPPPPVEIKTNEKGVQELTLVVTPGGYSPLRFAVKKDVPVRLIFRQLGQVGCGNELIFPADPKNPASLRLASENDQQVLEFTPHQTGQFQFYCSHQMYRGVMVVQ